MAGDVIRPAAGSEQAAEEAKRLAKEEVAAPRAFNSRQRDYDIHGYSPRCAGCRALLMKTSRQKHTDECRRRMERMMKDDARVHSAKRRRSEFKDKVMGTSAGDATMDGDGGVEAHGRGVPGADQGQQGLEENEKEVWC